MKKVEVEIDDLLWLMDLAGCCDYLRDYDRLTLMNEKYDIQKVWYKVYPFKFFRTLAEAHNNLIEPLDWRPIKIITNEEKEKIEAEIDKYGLDKKTCKKCGYTQICQDGLGRNWCTRCFYKKGIETRLKYV